MHGQQLLSALILERMAPELQSLGDQVHLCSSGWEQACYTEYVGGVHFRGDVA